MVDKIQRADSLNTIMNLSNKSMDERFLELAKEKNKKNLMQDNISLTAMTSLCFSLSPIDVNGDRGGFALESSNNNNKQMQDYREEQQEFILKHNMLGFPLVAKAISPKKDLLAALRSDSSPDIKTSSKNSESVIRAFIYNNVNANKSIAEYVDADLLKNEEICLKLASVPAGKSDMKSGVVEENHLIHNENKNIDTLIATAMKQNDALDKNESFNKKLMASQLNQIKNSMSINTENVNEAQKPISFNFQFQRWSGDHSVKVSLPHENLRDGNIILQASDSRAVDALHRQIEHWPRQAPEIYNLERDKGEQKNSSNRQDYEEEEE